MWGRIRERLKRLSVRRRALVYVGIVALLGVPVFVAESLIRGWSNWGDNLALTALLLGVVSFGQYFFLLRPRWRP